MTTTKRTPAELLAGLEDYQLSDAVHSFETAIEKEPNSPHVEAWLRGLKGAEAEQKRRAEMAR